MATRIQKTAAQMGEFLREENWETRRFHWYGLLYWIDPLSDGLLECSVEGTEKAYLIATKRRQRQELRKLNAAGFFCVGKNKWRNKSTSSKTKTYTRLQALRIAK